MEQNPSSLVQRLYSRIEGRPAWVLVIELFIGFGWLRAGSEKIIDPTWWSGEVIDQFIAEHNGSVLDWYAPVLDSIIAPATPLLIGMVIVAQLIVGTLLLTGQETRAVLGLGVFMNLNFLAIGAVTPSAFYLLAQGVLLFWHAEQKRNPSTVPLSTTAAISAGLALGSIPHIMTLHPAEVIDDPAAMYVFGGFLTAAACLLILFRPALEEALNIHQREPVQQQSA